MSEELRLSAQDAEDLEVISAQMQDAVLKVGDLAHLPGKRRFALVANRFRWEAEVKWRGWFAKGRHERVRTGLHFENVMKVRTRNIAQDKPDGVLNLLAIRFEETDTPAGVVTLVFSGGGEIRLDVEALEAHLSDLGLKRETPLAPRHED
ncbi:hypothetical protein FHS78_003330 [Parvibaculum indicum]|uniref:DUF2948 family protein n=1 Tax=Parvibaculum indicum TaxID=562969 RepID=UPI00142201D6|nr:DUF2948 family protein [Parvibaculum indicum]NIJ43022.1 hypothetical protein [Parvibaculum indicum]